jgi:hypothetical protein
MDSRADSLTRSANKPAPKARKRFDKATLGRIKLATIVLSIIAFIGSLVSIIQFNPGVKGRAAAPGQVQPITIVSPNNPSLQVVPFQSQPQFQTPFLQPFGRTRGS